MLRLYRILVNNTLLRLGYTLVNRTGGLVQWYGDVFTGHQVWSNTYRKKPYSLDDVSWRIYGR